MSLHDSSTPPFDAGGADGSHLLAPRVADALAALDAAADLLAGLDVLELDGPLAAVITGRVAAATSRLSAVAARLLPVVEADGLWAVDGAKSFGAWVARRHGLPSHAAHGQVRLGRTLRDHLPLTAAAVAAGEITVDHAQVLARYGPATEQRRRVLADGGSDVNEAFLVDRARELPVDQFRTLCRHWWRTPTPMPTTAATWRRATASTCTSPGSGTCTTSPVS